MQTEKELVLDLQKSLNSQNEKSSQENIEILDSLPSNLNQSEHQTSQWSLQEFSDEKLELAISGMPKYILNLLESNGLGMDELIKTMAEKAQYATTINPVTGEVVQSDTVQLSYIKEILNMLKLRQANNTIFFGQKINLTKILYGIK